MADSSKVFKEDRCYRPDEVQAALGYNSIQSVYNLINSGKLKASKLGGTAQAPIRIKGTELNRFLEENEVDPLGVKDVG